MKTATLNTANLMVPEVIKTIEQRSLIVGVVGAVATVVGFVLSRDNFYSAYLISYMDLLGLSLGCMAVLMLYHLVGGKWGTVIRRFLEAGMMTLPMMFVLFLPILLSIPRIYPWAAPGHVPANPTIASIEAGYLNATGMWIRWVIYFAIWIVMAYFLNRWSTEQDTPEGGAKSTLRFRALSGPGLVIYAFSISFAVIDWVMSLQAHWISTIYGFIFIAGQALAAFSFAVLIEAILVKREPLSNYLTPVEVHDHGKMMLAFVMVWAYFSYSQWLIMWAGNLPDEISWFLRRIHGGWGYVGVFLAAFHFGVPFALLLSRPLKRKTTTLVWVAAWLLIMRWVDIWWHVEPAPPFQHATIHLSWLHFATVLGMGGFWAAYFCRNLRARPLLAVYAPQTLKHMESHHG